MKKFVGMFGRFDIIPTCLGQTDGQTDGRTDIMRQHRPRYTEHRAVKR